VRYRVTFPGREVAIYEDGRWSGTPAAVDAAQAAEPLAAGRLRDRGGYLPDYAAALAAEVAALCGARMDVEGEPLPAPLERVY
jgi:hypothetical protein